MLFPQATDPDAGANGDVRYRIVNHPDLFVVSSNGSIYTRVPLDRELQGQYELLVEASDGAVDPRRTTIVLSIKVTDIDDNSPVFSQQSYVVNVPENSPVGTVILQLSVRFSVMLNVMLQCVFSHMSSDIAAFLFSFSSSADTLVLKMLNAWRQKRYRNKQP